VKPQRPKVEPIRQPTLFQMEKLDQAAGLAPEPNIEHPYSLPEFAWIYSQITLLLFFRNEMDRRCAEYASE
jgi:hypothetical protein